jgi:hypothetical protein
MSPNVCVFLLWKLLRVTVVAPRRLKWFMEHLCISGMCIENGVSAYEVSRDAMRNWSCAYCDRLLWSASLIVRLLWSAAYPSKSVCLTSNVRVFSTNWARGSHSHIELSQSKHVRGLQRSCWASNSVMWLLQGTGFAVCSPLTDCSSSCLAPHRLLRLSIKQRIEVIPLRATQACVAVEE